MTHPLMPPASPGDDKRPATAADIVANPITHAAWLDYANDLHQRAIARGHRALNRYLAGETAPEPLIIYNAARCPLGQHRGERRDAHGETLATILRLCGIAVSTAANWAGLKWNTVANIANGETVPYPATRAKIADALGYDPATISWPEHGRTESDVA